MHLSNMKLGIGHPATTLVLRREKCDFSLAAAACGGGVRPCTQVALDKFHGAGSRAGRWTTSKLLRLTVLLITIGVAAPALAEDDSSLKEGARDVGRAVGTAAREVGKGAKKVGKAVGEAAKEGFEAVKEGAKEAKRAMKQPDK